MEGSEPEAGSLQIIRDPDPEGLNTKAPEHCSFTIVCLDSVLDSVSSESFHVEI